MGRESDYDNPRAPPIVKGAEFPGGRKLKGGGRMRCRWRNSNGNTNKMTFKGTEAGSDGEIHNSSHEEVQK